MTDDAASSEAAELSEAEDESEAASAKAAEESEAAPTIDVICGTMRAKFLVNSWRVVVNGALATSRSAAEPVFISQSRLFALASVHVAHHDL